MTTETKAGPRLDQGLDYVLISQRDKLGRRAVISPTPHNAVRAWGITQKKREKSTPRQDITVGRSALESGKNWEENRPKTTLHIPCYANIISRSCLPCLSCRHESPHLSTNKSIACQYTHLTYASEGRGVVPLVCLALFLSLYCTEYLQIYERKKRV